MMAKAGSPDTLYETSKLNFEHIKYGERCPLTNYVLTRLLQDKRYNVDHKNISLQLAQILDDCHGNEEIVNNRRKVICLGDYICNANDKLLKWFSCGSVGDGFRFNTSDSDAMHIMKTAMVTYLDQIHLIPQDDVSKTILLMREAGCRPGYVTLEIERIADEVGYTSIFQDAIVSVGNSMFLSSDIYRQRKAEALSRAIGLSYVSNGPCATVVSLSYAKSLDVSNAFPCVCWPNAANEWIRRTRFHGWPCQTLIDQIVKDGCHVVPVGDKCSTDTLLQWRISFTSAEQILVHSLTHPQFRVYGLLKYFLSRIKDSLEHIVGDADILCSYFLKTVIFYAVENSSPSLWVDQNTFVCFRFCLSILIAWVRAGYCPNYFIRNNNLFLRKIHGESRQKLLHFLVDLYGLNWMCLCVESKLDPYIGRMLQGRLSPISSLRSDYIRDIDLFRECLFELPLTYGEEKLFSTLQRFYVSQTDADEFISYFAMTSILCCIAHAQYDRYNATVRNKHKYVAMKKCRHLLTPKASMCTSPGVLTLATFHYLMGNYRTALQMCTYMRQSSKIYISKSMATTDRTAESESETNKAAHNIPLLYKRYSGQVSTFHQRFKECFYSVLVFKEYDKSLCLPHLHLELKMHRPGLFIPPLPYAAFLSFLCYNELGDKKRREIELMNLLTAICDREQGGHRYWIVHTLLGICYQTVGDNQGAIRSFVDSVEHMPEYNPAIQRIESLISSS